jgi:preprotein translocase subunit Sec63
MDEREPGNFYKRLGVSRSATPEAIRKAFRRYALAHHPDKAPPEQREQATRDFQSVQQAYDVLSDGAVRTHIFHESLNCLSVPRPRARIALPTGCGVGAGMRPACCLCRLWRQ